MINKEDQTKIQFYIIEKQIIYYLKNIYRILNLQVFLQIINFILSIFVSAFLLFKNRRNIRESDKIILGINGGFGHTITMPDVARRLYAGRITLIILSERGRHNWKIGEIWPEIEMIFLLKSIFWKRVQLFNFHSTILTKMVVMIINYYNSGDVLFAEDEPNLPGDNLLYNDLKIHYNNKGILIKNVNDVPLNADWVVYWYRIIKDKQVRNPRLPNPVYIKFKEAIDRKIGNDIRFITIYSRQKGGPNSPTEYILNGGSFEDYRVIYEYLFDKGYAVFLVGDTNLEDCPDDLRMNIWDAGKLGFDKDWFSIAAVLNCERFVGDAGGGSWLSFLTDKPSLSINSAPYSHGVPNHLLLYKCLIDSSNKEIPLNECFQDYHWTTEFPDNYQLRNNNPDELLAAVEELFSVSPTNWKDYINPQNIFPRESWACQAPSRLAQIQMN